MDKRTIEGIEACRPLSDDLQSADLSDVEQQVRSDPQARLVYQRVQQWDAAISAAMEQVPLPPGLAQRMVAGLSATGAAVAPSHVVAGSGAGESAATPAEDHLDATVKIRATRARWSRRHWIRIGGGSAMAAALLIAAGLAIVRPRSDIPLEAMAEDWLQELDARPHGWQSLDLDRGFRIPPSITAQAQSWQPIAKHATGVAYKLVHPTAGTAVLYVVRLSRAGLAPAPPVAPQSTTGGKAIGYWRSDGLIYVLVVPGDERSYRMFVRSAPVPLA